MAKREISDVVRLFEIVDAINRIGLHLTAVISPEFIALMALWKKDGRPAHVTRKDESFSRETIEALSVEIEKICSHAIDVVELAGPLLAKSDETRAFRRKLEEARSSVN